MRRLHEGIRRKRQDLWQNNLWVLNRDNAPGRTSLLARDLLLKTKPILVTNSPNITPAIFFLFLKLQRLMKGRICHDLGDKNSAAGRVQDHSNICIISEVIRDLKKALAQVFRKRIT